MSISAEFNYESRFIDVHGSKIHYIEAGTGDPILFLHGNPTWSYLWRNIIPHLTSSGRCIAMDLIGMGRSDKPDIEYRFTDHAQYVEGFIETMGLRNLTIVIHDWGSALGFHYAMRHESNVKGIAFMEAILMPTTWAAFPKEVKTGFKLLRTPVIGKAMVMGMNAFVEKILPSAIVRKLTRTEMNFYREPFRRMKDRKPAWRWPNEIPIDGKPADVTAIVEEFNRKLQASHLPKLLFYAHPGAIMRKPLIEWCKQNLKNLKTVDIGRGIHYLQEDNPELIGTELAKWYKGL